MPRKFHNDQVSCPNCGYTFDTDDATDTKPDYKTDPSTSRTDGDDPDNTGADEDVSELDNSMTNKSTPQDSLAKLLVAAAQKNSPKAKAEKPVAKPANEQSAAQMLTQALADTRAKLIGRK